MTNREVLYDRKDADLFYRRKYFIYKKDRMRSPSYHLELDGIVKNTEEHRRLKRRIFKAEEGEDVLEFKEITRLHLEEEKGRIKEEIVKKEVMKQIEEEEKARVKDEEEKKLKRMLDKVELTKRWYEMNKNNAELWKQEQKRNERKWREILMKDDGKRQELEAQWQEVELKFDEERDQVKTKHDYTLSLFYTCMHACMHGHRNQEGKEGSEPPKFTKLLVTTQFNKLPYTNAMSCLNYRAPSQSRFQLQAQNHQHCTVPLMGPTLVLQEQKVIAARLLQEGAGTLSAVDCTDEGQLMQWQTPLVMLVLKCRLMLRSD